MWQILEGTLDEDGSALAYIDERAMRTAAGYSAEDTDKRFDPRRYNHAIQITDVGGATSVDIDVMGPGGLWSSWETGKVAGDTVFISTGWWRKVRLTWTGGAPDGTGVASFESTPKYNGLA